MEKKLEITLVRSLIGEPERTRRTVRSLGLKRINSKVVQRVNGALLGKLERIKHLVAIREVQE